MNVHTDVCMHVCMHARMHVRMYVHGRVHLARDAVVLGQPLVCFGVGRAHQEQIELQGRV